MKVLFYSNIPHDSGSFIYRILSPIDGLIRNGYSVKHINNINSFKKTVSIFRPNLVILYKPLFDKEFIYIKKTLSQLNIKLYIDIDDFMER